MAMVSIRAASSTWEGRETWQVATRTDERGQEKMLRISSSVYPLPSRRTSTAAPGRVRARKWQ